MVDFIRKRLQVFVSSTYEDLKTERQAAVEAILTAGHIPAGMELFTSGDESQMEVIKQWIDESDAYLLILGGRYGSIEPHTEKSYTQIEYEYAASKNIPLFACVITESAIESRVKKYGTKVIETARPLELKSFRELVLSKMSRFWEDAKDIKIAVSETLGQFSRRDELLGWVRPSEQANMPALADEIARLSRENAELRRQQEKRSSEPLYEGLTFQEMSNILESRDLLSIFVKLIGNPDLSIHIPVYKEFLQLGLVRESASLLYVGVFQTPVSLTETGRQFLMRWEAINLQKAQHLE